MVKTRVHYVIYDGSGEVVASGFCDSRVLEARQKALGANLSLLEIESSLWETVHASPTEFMVSKGALVRRPASSAAKK